MVKKILAMRFLLIIIALVLIGGYVFYSVFLKPKGVSYITEKAVKGTVIKEVSDTGTVRSNNKIEMSFKGIGKIEEIYVKNGDIVKAGQALVKLDISDLQSQLNQAYADLSVSQAKKADASVSLGSTEQSLKDAESKAEDDLNNACDDGLTALTDAYTKIYVAYSVVYEIQRTYFSIYQGDAGTVIDYRDVIQEARDDIKGYIDEIGLLSGDKKKEEIESAVSKTKQLVSNCLISINGILDIARSGGFKDEILLTDKTSLETQRANLNTLYSSVITAEQDIVSIKIANETNINDAKSQVDSLKNQLQNNSKSLYEAQVRQAEAKISILEVQVKDSILKSPIDGKVVELDKKSGETVQAKEAVVSVLSNNYFEVKVNIYEGDIADVRVGNPVSVELVAFPEQIITGKVVSVDPSEKLISEVVYYETTISLDSEPEGAKEGMTADVTIEVFKKENALMIPRKSIEKINGDRIVKVLKNGKIGEVKVKTGLEGNDYTEIISGLNEGEEVVIGNKI
ncbi:MAG: efflux RND transporter periplasmic adaptor subunit [Candidatus Nealsonbacteria bacterium]|nr:efflux RND transporter periplasmic adaptor subunit [Candidatus Nealsonbacteria bacterium]